MSYLLVVRILDHLLVFFRRLERITGWAITKVVPRHKDGLWIRVSLFLQLGNLVLGEEFHSTQMEEVASLRFKFRRFAKRYKPTDTAHRHRLADRQRKTVRVPAHTRRI